MIDEHQSFLAHVRYVGHDSPWAVSFAEVGIITEVDGDDHVSTYRVLFPSVGEPKWFHNKDLEKVTTYHDLECNWKNRALKAEGALANLKAALSLLSED